MDESRSKRRPSVKDLSKTPSWVMLGFLLGAAFVWTLRRAEPSVRTVVIAPAKSSVPAPRHPTELTIVEAVFAQWDHFAIWENDVTQVAMWDVAEREFSNFYEVRRIHGDYFFRSIPRLSNRIVRHGNPVPAECPLRFTETEEQYRDWLEHGRFERAPDVVGGRPNAAIDLPAKPSPTVERPAPSLPHPAPPLDLPAR